MSTDAVCTPLGGSSNDVTSSRDPIANTIIIDPSA
jgi:hypothetical protein